MERWAAKAYGGKIGNVYRLYDAMVNSMISYGTPVFGTPKYSCISAVQHRACRFFLGVGMQQWTEIWVGYRLIMKLSSFR